MRESQEHIDLRKKFQDVYAMIQADERAKFRAIYPDARIDEEMCAGLDVWFRWVIEHYERERLVEVNDAFRDDEK